MPAGALAVIFYALASAFCTVVKEPVVDVVVAISVDRAFMKLCKTDEIWANSQQDNALTTLLRNRTSLRKAKYPLLIGLHILSRTYQHDQGCKHAQILNKTGLKVYSIPTQA
ncbi:hypothetical protein DPMN_125429 [Dreissena polymorpha]|uniref:Secreted protein n=1 Tax=Dreissena polymorpha TaxID=45954 RepID=A0A9D4GY90_DREPO|nr:hypothetical protein DPMN_125429 [Dreissena polymorpha]